MAEQYLFLDIDGVLNNDPWHGSLSIEDTMPEKVALLCDWLAEHPDVQVVLSSAWRHYWSARQIQEALQKQDERFPAFFDQTEDLLGQGRDIEILLFLRGRTLANPDARAVVLDDWPFRNATLANPLLVKTNPSVGLTKKDLQAASEKLLTPIAAQDIDWETFMDRAGRGRGGW